MKSKGSKSLQALIQRGGKKSRYEGSPDKILSGASSLASLHNTKDEALISTGELVSIVKLLRTTNKKLSSAIKIEKNGS